MQWLYHTVRYLLVHWGYWAVLAGLLGENAGLPIPGETVLVFAGFLSNKGVGLHLDWIILIGIGAATTGDNIGFLLGRKFGPRLINWLKKVFRLDDEDIDVAKEQIQRHGAASVFWARFIFGLRVVAGPLAGMLDMEWREFFLFNFLGAATWVMSMAMIGFVFADQFSNLLTYFEKASWVMLAVLVSLGYFLWHHQRKRYEARHHQQNHT